MPVVKEHRKLKKDLNLLAVYALATGATLSSGFFLLPGLAFAEAGPAVILSYLLAVLPLLPAMFSIMELSTAMPRAGGAYYFIDRSMGPLLGTIGGLGTWVALMLKTAFALIGMGAYINLFLPKLPIVPTAATLAIIFAAANYFGARKSGTIQIVLVTVLLTILTGFIAGGLPRIDPTHLQDFFGAGSQSIIGTAGLVYISYVGVTNVASVAEEVENPERNLPLGIILSVATAILIYGLGTLVMVGVVPAAQLGDGTLTPVADAAEIIAGRPGLIIATIAALAAFFAVANAGILSSSRYPLAMSRDHLLPTFFRRFNRQGMPSVGIYSTLVVILFIIFFLDPLKIAKLASAFQLLLFAFLCAAVIVMRESRIESYDPGYRSPAYPWMQIFGIVVAFAFIFEMGRMAILFSSGLILSAVAWYFFYARRRVARTGAILHVFDRLGRGRHEGLDRELRGIMKEKGLRKHDIFDELVLGADLIDLRGRPSFEEATRQAASALAKRMNRNHEVLAKGFMEGTLVGATPVAGGAALPHMRLPDMDRAELVIVRCPEGVEIEAEALREADVFEGQEIHAVFFLASPSEDAAQHLRILAQLATQIDDDKFMGKWAAASDERELKALLLREDRCVSIHLDGGESSVDFINHRLGEVELPSGCAIVQVHREGAILEPDPDAVLRNGDWITILGDPEGISHLTGRHSLPMSS